MSYYSFSQVCITLVKQIFHLHIKKSTTILEDYQPWEGSQKTAKTFTLTVVVKYAANSRKIR